MLRGFRSRLTYANVTATLALFIALGGVSYAAVALPRNSVGSAQIKKNAVTGAKIKSGAISQSDLSKAVRAQVAKAGVPGPRGTPGSKGDPGSRGDKGDPGPAAVLINRTLPLPSSGITTDLLAQVGDLSVYGECIAGLGSRLSVASATAAQATWFTIDTSNALTSGSGALTSTTTPFAVAGLLQPSKNGQLIYRSAGRTVTLAFYIQGDAGGCLFGGTLVNAPAT